jgi:uncharacterized protein (TIGR03083 family)
MESDPRKWIGSLRNSHDRLVAFVADLDDDRLGEQSMCSEWSVAQVLSHLGSGAEIGLATLAANVAREELPGSEAMSAIWERWNAMSPGEMASGFVSSDRTLVESLEGLTADQLDHLRVQLPFLPEPVDVASVVGFRLDEHALHGWDVFAAFEPSASLAPDAAELLIDRLPMKVGLVGRLTRRDTRPATTATISITTSSPTRHFQLELGDVIELRPSRPDSGADGDLTIPAEALLRLTAGRLKPGRPSAEVAPTGVLTLDDLQSAFPGY